MKFRLPTLVAFLISFAFLAIPLGNAESSAEKYFAYILPPETQILLNGETLSNDNEKATATFFAAEDEQITVSNETTGVRIKSNAYTVDIKPESVLSIDHALQLESGSIHLSSAEEQEDQVEMLLGDMILRFTSAEFVAFRSGDASSSVIKVIAGAVEVESPSTQQVAQLETNQATSTDAEGRLLIPFASEVDTAKGWWTAKSYQTEPADLPIASAGADQRVLKNMPVTLDGSDSTFNTGDIFEWKLTDAPNGTDGKPIKEVALNIINIVKPIFTPSVDGEYTFTLRITDKEGGVSNVSTVLVFVGREYLEPQNIFPDVKEDHPNNLAITYLYKKNVMRGSQDPETGEVLFRPDDTINRVEILKTIFENLGVEVPSKEQLEELEEGIFDDVKAEHWFAPYVAYAKERGIVKGNNGIYRPADEVILVEAMKIVVESSQINVDALQSETELPYPDTELGAWYNPYLFFVKKYELFDASAKGNINPGKPLTRAEFAEIIYRMESKNIKEKKGFISGRVIDIKSRNGVPNAEILVFRTEEGEGDFVEKGELFDKISSDESGKFTFSLPVHSSFSIEAVTDDEISTNRIIVQVGEDEIKSVELEIETQ